MADHFTATIQVHAVKFIPSRTMGMGTGEPKRETEQVFSVTVRADALETLRAKITAIMDAA